MNTTQETKNAMQFFESKLQNVKPQGVFICFDAISQRFSLLPY
jgi:hypothetical protein